VFNWALSPDTRALGAIATVGVAAAAALAASRRRQPSCVTAGFAIVALPGLAFVVALLMLAAGG
jgi:hypothetical protein